jgi:hypothetical protein
MILNNRSLGWRNETQKSPNILHHNWTLKINAIVSPNPTKHSKKLNNNQPGRPLWFAFFYCPSAITLTLTVFVGAEYFLPKTFLCDYKLLGWTYKLLGWTYKLLGWTVFNPYKNAIFLKTLIILLTAIALLFLLRCSLKADAKILYNKHLLFAIQRPWQLLP